MLCLLIGTVSAQARPPHKRALADYFGPFLAKNLNDCRTCHVPEKPGTSADALAEEKPHNPFGARLAAVRKELRKAGKKASIPQCLEIIANEDSDGDGVPNLVELLTGHNPGDPEDRPTAAELAESGELLAAFRKHLQAYRWTPMETAKRPPAPKVKNPSWVRNPIDAFLAAEHEAHGLRPRPEAAKEVVLRRVYLDLIGLPPTREELHAFLDDPSPDAYEKVVDRLLARSEYGERWGRHWMDVWRYSDWAGFGAEVRESHQHIWHWRDWIIESVNHDKPYDRMILEMLAADELAPTDADSLRATGFLVRNWYIFNRNTWLEKTVEHTSKAFLGITMNCARCHDHLFDPISQKEYYQFRAFFEPHNVRLDRLPGQPDVEKAGLPRAYDAFLDTPTYLYVRGNEANPDKSQAISPGVPAVLGGQPIDIVPVSLPSSAYCPDKRDFVIQETLAAGEQAITQARAALGTAKENLVMAELKLAAAIEADRQAQAKLPALLARPEELKKAQAAAATAAEELARAQQKARVAPEHLRQAELSVILAEARQTTTQAVIKVERLEDAGAKQKEPEAWKKAAQDTLAAQRRLAALQARHGQLTARLTLKRLQEILDGLTAAAEGQKDNQPLQAVLKKTATDLVDARGKLAVADDQLAQAEREAQKPPATAYTPRPLSFPRAKISYTEPPSNDPYPKTSTGRRLALARWIASPENPLTARVAMNHIWLRHFGKAIVPSLFDFGRNGQPPTHPALLDWLAVEFMARGWSMKAMHRLIVTSRAYRMDALSDQANAAIDPDNRYLWRRNIHRMEAEVVRDSVLYVAGQLDPALGGPDIPHEKGLSAHRRSLYFQHAAEKTMVFLSLYDNANVTECYARTESVVPQQALALANSSLVLEQSRLLARSLSQQVGEQATPAATAAFLTAGFEQVLGRAPTEQEREVCEEFLKKQSGLLADRSKLTAYTSPRTAAVGPAPLPHMRAREDLIQVLMNHNDFVTIR